MASYLAEPLRLALLLHEITNKFGSTVRVEIGDPIGPEELAQWGGRAELTDALHDRVWSLATTEQPAPAAAAAMPTESP